MLKKYILFILFIFLITIMLTLPSKLNKTLSYKSQTLTQLKYIWDQDSNQRIPIVKYLVSSKRINSMNKFEITNFFGQPNKQYDNYYLYGFLSNNFFTYTYCVKINFNPNDSIAHIKSYIINSDIINSDTKN